MVTQYAHYLFREESTGESTQDESGFYTDEEQRRVFVSKCREETNGQGQEIQGADGTFHKYSAIVQLPKGSTPIKEGTSVIVTDDAKGVSIRITGIVLKYDKGQLHNRLWV